ncbi:Cytochrome P450 4c3, partial [Gryllus bimaculatus]
VKWRSRRKALTPAFHFKIIDQFVPVFNSCSDVFVQQMRARVGAKGFDIAESHSCKDVETMAFL